MRLQATSSIDRYAAWPRLERARPGTAGDFVAPTAPVTPVTEEPTGPRMGLPLPAELVGPGDAQRLEDGAEAKEAAGAGEEEESAAKGETRLPNELTPKEKDEVAKLSRRDAEVRAHEAAHAAAAGSFGGGASYEYATGPDGRRYAVGGEVPVRIVGGRTPEEAIRNASQVRAAALAPADPSAQDMAVAAEAASIEAAARAELAQSRTVEATRREASETSAAESSEAAGRVRPGKAGEEGDKEGGSESVAAWSERRVASAPELNLDPDETVRQLEQERRSSRGQWRHLHLASGCGNCSAAAASYR